MLQYRDKLIGGFHKKLLNQKEGALWKKGNLDFSKERRDGRRI